MLEMYEFLDDTPKSEIGRREGVAYCWLHEEDPCCRVNELGVWVSENISVTQKL